MSQTVKNVALAGASGSLGSKILAALVTSGVFSITLLFRKPFDAPPTIKTKLVDFSSLSSLAAALQGQDALIDATSSFDASINIRLLDAAVRANVPRIIPAEFGGDPNNQVLRSLPVFAAKKIAYEHLLQLAADGKITYTTISNAGFLDWVLQARALGIDVFEKEVQLLEDDPVVPWTMLDAVATAVTTALKKPQETRNKNCYIHSIYKSHRALGELCKQAIGNGEGWTEEVVDKELMKGNAMRAVENGTAGMNEMVDLIKYATTTKGYVGIWEKDDNELLGIEELDDEAVRVLARKTAGGRS